MRSRIRNLISILTAFSLTLSGLLPVEGTFPLKVYAAQDRDKLIEAQPEVMEAKDRSTLIPGIAWFGSFNDEKADLPVRYFYSDDYFTREHPATDYNQHLATMSLIMAMSGFSSNLDWNGDRRLYDNQYRNVQWLMNNTGFGGKNFYVNKAYKEKPKTDSIGVAIGHKVMKEKNGDEYTLIAVTLRGAGYESEWASNVKVGKGSGDNSSEHEGFREAADTVLSEIKTYLGNKGLENKPLKYWITGYSRAGATANLTGYQITSRPEEFFVRDSSRDNIYVYDFEAPQGGQGQSAPNIHNIINPGDIVPRVSPSKWGTERYGTDYLIGEIGTQSYKTNRIKMKSKLDSLSKEVGELYNKFPDRDKIDLYGLTINYASRSISKKNEKAKYIDSFMGDFINFVATSPAFKGDEAMASGRNTQNSNIRREYADRYQNDIRWFISWIMGGNFTNKLLNESKKNTVDEMGVTTGGLGFLWDLRSVRQHADVDKNHNATDKEKKEYKSYMDSVTAYLMGYNSGIPGMKKALDNLKNEGAYSKEYDRDGAERVIGIVLRLALNLLADDYRETGTENINIGTAASLGSSLITAHIPEVTLAWMMAFDSYYSTDRLNRDYTDILLPAGKDFDIQVLENNDMKASWSGENMTSENPLPLGGYVGITRYNNEDYSTYRIPQDLYTVSINADKDYKTDDLDFYVKTPNTVYAGYSINEDVFYSDPDARERGEKASFDGDSVLEIVPRNNNTDVYKDRMATIKETLGEGWDENTTLSDIREGLYYHVLKTKDVTPWNILDILSGKLSDNTIIERGEKLSPKEEDGGKGAVTSFFRDGNRTGYSITPVAAAGLVRPFTMSVYSYNKTTGKKGKLLAENIRSFLDTEDSLFSDVDDILIEYSPVGTMIKTDENIIAFKLLNGEGRFSTLDKDHPYFSGSDAEDVIVAWPYFGAKISRGGQDVSVCSIKADNDNVSFERQDDGFFRMLNYENIKAIKIEVETENYTEPVSANSHFLFVPYRGINDLEVNGQSELENRYQADCWSIPDGARVKVTGRADSGQIGWDVIQNDLLDSHPEEAHKYVDTLTYEFDMPSSDVHLSGRFGNTIKTMDNIKIISKEELDPADRDLIGYTLKDLDNDTYGISFNGADKTVFVEMPEKDDYDTKLCVWMSSEAGTPIGDPIDCGDPYLPCFRMPSGSGENNIILTAEYTPTEYEFQVWNGTAQYRTKVNNVETDISDVCYGTLSRGTDLKLIADPPEAGCRFSHWEILTDQDNETAESILGSSETSSTAEIKMPGYETAFVAVYEPIPPVTHGVSVAGGEIYEDDGEIKAPYENAGGKKLYTLSEGQTYRIEHYDEAGKVFTGWDISGKEISFFRDGSGENEGCFTMPDGDLSFSAVYAGIHKVTVENGYVADESGNKSDITEFTEGSPVYLIPGGDAEYRDSCGWMSDDPEVQKALDEIAGQRNTENGGSMFVMPDRDVKVTYGTRRKSESFTAGGHSYEIEWNETAVYNGKKTKPEELAIKVVKDGQELPSSDYKAAVKGKTVVSASGNKAPYIRISFKKKADKEAKKSVKKLKLSFLVTERSIASIDLKSKKVMLKDGKVVIKGLSWKNPYGKRIGLKSLNKKGKGDISIGETVKLGDETGVWIYGKNNYKGSALLKVE